MDAGIGSARALGQRRFSRDAAESGLEFSLDGWKAGLDLPTLKIGAVVGEGELPGLEAGVGLGLVRHLESLYSSLRDEDGWVRSLDAPVREQARRGHIS